MIMSAQRMENRNERIDPSRGGRHRPGSHRRIATAKAWTAGSLAGPSRNFAMMAESRPQFATSLVTISQGRMAPAAGGVLVLRDGDIIGSVGVSGDTPDNDEAAALDGVHAAGLAS